MTVRAYIRPRKLDKRVRIDTLVTTKGTSGAAKEQWTAGPFVWAGIDNRAGRLDRSTDAGGGEVPRGDVTIEMRYRANIKAGTTRLVRGETVYTILHVDDAYQQHDRLTLSCQTGVRGV